MKSIQIPVIVFYKPLISYKHPPKILCLWIFLLVASTSSFAKDPYKPHRVEPLSELWRYTHFSELDGKGIRSFAKDHDGNYWFGVNTGVIRYDGYSFKLYSQAEGLTGRDVDHLLLTKDNQLLASTSSGIFILNGNSWKKHFPLSGNFNFSFKSMKQLRDGSLVCGILEGLLVISKSGNILLSNKQKSEFLLKKLPGTQYVELPVDCNFTDVSDILEYSPGKLWIGLSMIEFGKIVDLDLAEIKKGEIKNFKVYSKKNGVYLGESQKLLLAKDKKIWVVNNSYKVGINCFDGKKWEYIRLGEKFGGDEYHTSISQSSNGTIWIGGLGKLFTFKEGEWKAYKSPEYNIPSSQVSAFHEKDGNLWLWGQQSKLHLIDLSEKNWQSWSNLNFQCEDQKGNQWFIAADGKIVVKEKIGWFSYNTGDGAIDAPNKIITTSKGQVWVAGSDKGFSATALLSGNKWEKHVHPSLSWGIDYRSVFEAKDGTIWFGSSVDHDSERNHLSGVLQLVNPLERKKHWIHHVAHQKGLDQTSFYGIAQSKDNRIWIGGAKLFSYKDEWKKCQSDNFQQFVNIVANDAVRNLYIGSRYYGLFVYDGKDWKQHNTENGLESNTIISIAAKSPNEIYAVTDNDISYFDGLGWVSHVFPSEMNMSNEGGDISILKGGSIWINKSSREWKRRAFNHMNISEDAYKNFKTYQYTPDVNPPNTKVTLFTAEVSKEGNTTVTWEAEDYLNRTPKSRMQYSFKLNDGRWSPFSHDKHFTFIGLEPGSYNLEVRSRDLDFNIDPTPARIAFTVLTPIWKQAWFVSMIVAFLILFAFLEFRIINKNKKLWLLNLSLKRVNQALKLNNKKIEEQNKVILHNQMELQASNSQLENKNHEIESQRDALQEMVQKVEVLSKAKVRFFTNITHEFRTPLTLIHGPVERVFNEKLSGSEKNQLHSIVKRNINRLQSLINQLLEIRDIEAGTLQLSLRKENIVRFISEMKSLFNNLASQRSIDFNLCSEMKSLDIAFDQDKIEKIILNLLSNAFKYTAPNGGITINLSLIEKDQEYFTIEVEDTGKGIAPENLQTIFERYNSVTKKSNVSYFESTGIGLSHIKELIEFHKGKIEVESELGKGSKFTVFIPTNLHADTETFAPELQIISKNEGSSMLEEDKIQDNEPEKNTVLVVEDNLDTKLFLKGILNEKFNVLEASNGLEAVEICINHEVDLIVSDIMMPEMDGLTLCEKIKSNFDTSHIPVVLLTAKNREEHKIEGYEHGADGYIEKPFNTKLLIIRIEKLLQHREKLRLKFSQDFNFKPKEVHVVSEDEKFLKKLVEVMELNMSDAEFDVDKMAEMMNKSHVQFIRKVKQLTGKKPIDLLKTFRLQRGKQLLEQGKLPVSEIAYMVGYDLPNSFTRAFKKEFGVAPKELATNVVI